MSLQDWPQRRDDQVMLDPHAQASLRQTILQWAVSTARTGETASSVLARAQAYLDFVVYPLRADVAAATHERNASALQ